MTALKVKQRFFWLVEHAAMHISFWIYDIAEVFTKIECWAYKKQERVRSYE
jgi:hypothetical protein